MKNFFVSYTSSDKKHAEWIAELLEAEGYSVIIQAWDFRPGDNFVSKINESLIQSEKLIIILSENYLKSKWCELEWTTKLAEQVKLNNRRIIPIRIEPVNLNGLLSPIIYIDIFDKTENEAIQEIKNGILDNVVRKSTGFQPFYNIEHIQIDNDYYVDKTKIVFIKTCKSKVMVEGMNKIHNRITWFADEKIELFSLTDGVTIEPLDLRDTNLNYNVVFDHILKKNEEVNYCVKAILTNDHRHFENFFSSEIIAPVERLNIHLNIEESNIKKVLTQKLSTSVMNIRTEEPEEHVFTSPFHWYITNPELHFEYKIFW